MSTHNDWIHNYLIISYIIYITTGIYMLHYVVPIFIERYTSLYVYTGRHKIVLFEVKKYPCSFITNDSIQEIYIIKTYILTMAI